MNKNAKIIAILEEDEEYVNDDDFSEYDAADYDDDNDSYSDYDEDDNEGLGADDGEFEEYNEEMEVE